jgi:hypothetical protein
VTPRAAYGERVRRGSTSLVQSPEYSTCIIPELQYLYHTRVSFST